MDTATKAGIDAAKTAWVIQKIAEATGDLIGNKIADKITSVGKSKEREKEKTNKPEEIYIPTEKRQQFIDDLKLFWIMIIIITKIIIITITNNYNNYNNHEIFLFFIDIVIFGTSLS